MMPVKPEARIIARSKSIPTGIEIITFKLRYWKAIHGELMTHRVFSRNAGSSRAIPSTRLIEEATDFHLRAQPVVWKVEQKGMSGGDELSGMDQYKAQLAWGLGAAFAGATARTLKEIGVHKSAINRVLEPYTSITVLVTTTEIDNFFGLRLDKGADDTMQYLANRMWDAYKNTDPMLLNPGEWHLPFIDPQTWEDIDAHHRKHSVAGVSPLTASLREVHARMISVARCARVSYESFDTGKRSTVVEDLALYERLVGSRPLHASPAEHQATPDELYCENLTISVRPDKPPITLPEVWFNGHEHGNFRGWRQYRKMLPDEACAPLPAGYER